MPAFTTEQLETSICVLEPFIGARMVNALQDHEVYYMRDLAEVDEDLLRSWSEIGPRLVRRLKKGLRHWYNLTRVD